MGALLGWWSWFAFRQKNPDVPGKEIMFPNPTVSHLWGRHIVYPIVVCLSVFKHVLSITLKVLEFGIIIQHHLMVHREHYP